jgi:site-specific recombinase XerD
MAGSGATKTAQLLTAKIIKALEADPAGPYRVPDSLTRGLGLRVAVDGGKSWDLAFRIKGAGVRRQSLGKYEDLGLEAARDRANELTSAARKGRDAIAEEKAARDEYDQSFTVARLVEEYAKRRLAGRLRSAEKTERLIRQTLAPVMKRKALDIRRRDLRQLLDKVADRGHVVAAEKRRTLVQTMFRWALRQDIVEIDPSAGLSPYGQTSARKRVLDLDEIGKLWAWLSGGGMPPHIADILRLQLCLGARVGEVAGMVAPEFERDASGRLLWRLPAAREKTGAERLTPILGLALGILEPRLKPPGGRLFVSERGHTPTTSDVGVAIINRRARMPIAKWASHDLRRTVATQMARLELPLDTIAIVIGQKAGAAGTQTLVKHYIHEEFLERKRTALEAWDRRLRAQTCK